MASKQNANPEPSNTPESEGGAGDHSGNETTGTESANLSAIASEFSATMPDVQEHAIETEKAQESEKLAQYSHLVDKDGNGFDPAIHKTNAKGEPSLSAAGKLVKKPGRKPGQSPNSGASRVASSVGTTSNSASQAQIDQQKIITARATGAMSANMLMTIGVMLGGDEWQPRVDKTIGLNEKEFLEQAFADYFEATGKTDLPPGMVLSFAIAGYAGPRMVMPQTKSRIGRVFHSGKKWWANRKLKKHGLKVEDLHIKGGDKKQATTEA